MRILYVTTIGGTMGFFKSLISELIEEGNCVDIATNESTSKVPDVFRDLGCKVFQISTSRSPFSFGNIKAIKQIRKIAKDYDIVHCHTPLAGMATRLACRKLRKKQGLRVIYTAHGFHFYKGAPKKNWLFFYPIEKMCSRWTDLLITINKEDFALAKKRFHARRTMYIPGVGIDISRFQNISVDREKKRRELGIPEKSTLILSVGELNSNKNHMLVLEALKRIDNSKIHYVIAGEGGKREQLAKYAKNNGIHLHLLGYRKDIGELMKAADFYCLPSIREGLNVSLIEAMSSGLGCVVSGIRGNIDLIDSEGGMVFKSNDANSLGSAIIKMITRDKKPFGVYNEKRSIIYSNDCVIPLLLEMYESFD